MRKSKALEVAIVVLIIGGAITYQLMHKAAAENEIVAKERPTLPEQVVPTKIESEVTSEPEVTKGPTIDELLAEYLGGLKSKPVTQYNPNISTLGKEPDWSELEKYQKTITRLDFERLLTTVYTIGDSWQQWIEIHDDHAIIVTHSGTADKEPFRLEFAKLKNAAPPREWKSAKQLGKPLEGKPMSGMTVAIDPGHIGADEWASVEERSFAVADDKPVREGVITLKVATLLKDKLENMGATVVLVRKDLNPVNPKRPQHYTHEAFEDIMGRNLVPSGPAVIALRNKMFYRIGEIRVRADLINKVIKPDLVLCLHFNAESWGDPSNPTLTDVSHFHVLLHGAFTAGELAKDDERFSMIKKIVMRNHDEEAGLCADVAEESKRLNKLPPYKYQADSQRARNVRGNDYLWARNLLANRLYEAPVVYMEPYVMNSKLDYKRIQLGDYDGLIEIDGVEYASIFKEYATGVANGLEKYYLANRGAEAVILEEPVAPDTPDVPAPDEQEGESGSSSKARAEISGVEVDESTILSGNE